MARRERRTRMDRLIVMIGTSPDTQGGISAVINAYRSAGLFERWPIVHLHSHVDGPSWRKLAVALAATVRFAGLLLARRVCLAHLHVASNASFWRKTIFVALARLAACPVVFHLHGGGFIDFYEKESGLLARRLIRIVLNSADCIVVVTSHWADELSRITTNRKIVVIPNPAPMPKTTLTAQRKNEQLLYLGRLCATKGTDDLLEAFVLVKHRFPAAALVLGGDGDRERLRSKARSLGISASVHMVGWITGKAKETLLVESSIFVLPSYVEGLPMGVLEAMSYGLPVVATRVGGLADVIEHGVDGVLVSPGRVDELALAISQLLLDATLRNRIAARAQGKCVERFAPLRVLAEVEALYGKFGLSTTAMSEADHKSLLARRPSPK